MTLVHGLRFDNLRGDIYGGLTAAVVALPLALAFGVASGAGPVAGLYGAIFVGLFAALFGGTPAQVSGPTGPMTVVMAAVVTQYAHEPAMAFTVVMMGGAIQIGLGLLRVGRFISLVPYPVVSGFMSGIGCIIILLELAPLVGRSNPEGGVLAAVQGLPQVLSSPVAGAVAVGVLSLAIVYGMPRRLNAILPAPLVALGACTVVAWLAFPSAPVIGDIPTGLPEPRLPAFSLEALPDMLKSAGVLAVLGAIDSLLTSLVADSITQTHHESNRELVGQGVGNVVAGLLGGIPGAGATMRTVVNVRAGGRTPISGALHALVLLAVVLGLGGFAAYIPHAVLAGILIKVGMDIIDWDYLRRVRRAPRQGVALMLVVLGLTVFVDLISAVAVGVVMASLMFVKQMADLQEESMALVQPDVAAAGLDPEEAEILREAGGRILLFRLGGPFSFGVANAMARRLGSFHHYDVLVLDLSAVPFMDSSAALALEEAATRARERGRQVLLVGLNRSVAEVLERLGMLAALGSETQFQDRRQALRAASDWRGQGDDSAS